MDGGVLNPENGFIFNLHGTSREDNGFLSMINSCETEFTNNDCATQFREDNVESESYAEFDDNRLSLSFGSYQNAASRSLTSSCSDIMEAYQIADWNDHLSSLNTSDDEYEVVNVADDFLFTPAGTGNPRMRSFSTSSLTGPCIPPDLIMESRDSEDFLSDSFHDLENVQEQIYLEDIQQNVQTDDMLVPLDDSTDAATLQKELIDKLTGSSSPPALAFSNNVGDTDGRLSSSHPKNEEVKMVNATPGSENVSIDGVDVSLPAGSIVLAVVNESGSLVPYSVNSQEFLNPPLVSAPEANFCLASKNSQSAELNENFLVRSPSELMNPLSQTFTGKDQRSNLLMANDAFNLESTDGSIKRKLSFEACNEKSEEVVDVETVSQTTPVLEACDLATLLYEFEATESVNRCIDEEKANCPIDKFSKQNEDQEVKIEQENIVTSYNTTESQALHPILAKALEKVTHDSSNRSRSSITITSTRPSFGGSSSTTTTSISIKVKKVDNSKPAKSLIERKNEMMKKKLVAHQRIKDALPLEIIEKIRASGARKTTKILTEAFIPKFMSRKKKFKLPQNKLTKGISKKKKDKIPQEKEPPSTSLFDDSAFQDHDYCMKSKKTFYIKKEIKCEPEVYNKLPDYCNPTVKIKEEKDMERVLIEKEMEIKTAEINKQESMTESKYMETPTNLHNRLPDYVTDIVNIKPKEECTATENQNQIDLEIIPNVENVNGKPKRKLNLSEYRMRIRSTENSRSSSPAISDKKTVKRFKSTSSDNSNFIEPTTNLVSKSTDNLDTPSTNNLVIPTTTPLGVVAIETPITSSNIVVPSSRPITPFGVVCIDDDDCQFVQEKLYTTLPCNAKRNGNQYINEVGKMPIKMKKVPVPRSCEKVEHATQERNQKAGGTVSSSPMVPAQSVNSSKRKLNSNCPLQNSTKKKPVIEIDLEEGELEDHEEENKETDNKLALLSLLPLSKMPTTSLGHSLLYTQKMKIVQAIEDRKTQKMQKVPSSSVSTSSITSSSSSISPHRYERSRRRENRNVCRSSSRSSRSSSSRKKLSRRSRSPGENSHLSTHRKSRRRWTRSHSRSPRRKSRSYSSSSVLSSDSSRSGSYSKSYSSRSRSRSRSSRRKVSHSRRHRGSRSRDNYRSRSRSRSRCYEDCKRSSRKYSKRSDRSYNSSTQQHMSTRYMTKHRSMADVERDVEERKIIYCGCIEEGTTRTELRSRFDKFGPIIDCNIHFRECGDNYGFVTFMYTESAFQALEHGNDDPKLPKYNLCFGGRRKFCTEQYSDLDAQKDEYDFYNSSDAMDYDTLLQTALNRRR